MSDTNPAEQVAVANINGIIGELKEQLDDILDPIEDKFDAVIADPQAGRFTKWRARSVRVAISALRTALDVPDDIGGDED